MTAFTAVRAAVKARRTRQSERTAPASLKAAGRALYDSALVIGGLGAVTIAAFQVATALGWLTAGLALFVLDLERSS